MSIFHKLEKQYYDIDDYYARKEFEASSKGWNRKEELYQQKREINDQAYFVFMFSRLEDRIKEESYQLILSKQGTSLDGWGRRAAWDILSSQRDKGITFKNRLALLTQKGSSDYNKVSDYYKDRNAIAHGGIVSSISMPTAINDFKHLYRILKRR
jgi:hypothetical protein